MKVFISFSHIDRDDDQKMIALTNQLRSDGIEANIYLLEPHPAEGWIKWMEVQVESADFILIYASQDYFDKFQQKNRSPSGGRYEGSLISSMIYSKGADFSKVGLICFESFDVASIPLLLQGCPRYTLHSHDDYIRLLRWLSFQPEYSAAPIGILKHLPSSNIISLFSTKKDTISNFRELCQALEPLLQENKRIFINFGPNSGKSNANRVRTDYTIWSELKKTKIVPNNEKIKNSIEARKFLIPDHLQEIFNKLLLHIEAFKIHVEYGGVDYRENQFPVEIDNIIQSQISAKE